MKKTCVIISLILTVMVNVAQAESVYLTVENSSQSSNALFKEIMKMSGPKMRDSIAPALYSVNNHDVALLDADMLAQDLAAVESMGLSDKDALIISGAPENNSRLTEHLLGYGVNADYIVIKGMKTPNSIKLIRFDKNDQASVNSVARSLMLSAMKQPQSVSK
ncbi:hypothetical protein SG34_029700 [Thalassomonas viridans]|uniref:Uncharacterized protein n=1 Tax=Thalassomonas viridans TaxID=137584 RepID=A0AAE9Z936_9GAMM|nr:hypothetical protein [Thalassomonas viridans]WDE08914.1 hypothetical protein SG34_034065 [Thalassomonas viridans]WDE08961.1 hypothetical protein SG34_029700 [Thalassomonas viridans]